MAENSHGSAEYKVTIKTLLFHGVLGAPPESPWLCGIALRRHRGLRLVELLLLQWGWLPQLHRRIHYGPGGWLGTGACVTWHRRKAHRRLGRILANNMPDKQLITLLRKHGIRSILRAGLPIWDLPLPPPYDIMECIELYPKENYLWILNNAGSEVNP